MTHADRCPSRDESVHCLCGAFEMIRGTIPTGIAWDEYRPSLTTTVGTETVTTARFTSYLFLGGWKWHMVWVFQKTGSGPSREFDLIDLYISTQQATATWPGGEFTVPNSVRDLTILAHGHPLRVVRRLGITPTVTGGDRIQWVDA